MRLLACLILLLTLGCRTVNDDVIPFIDVNDPRCNDKRCLLETPYCIEPSAPVCECSTDLSVPAYRLWRCRVVVKRQ